MMRHQILIDEMQTKLWELTGIQTTFVDSRGAERQETVGTVS